ncbi:MAG TPA: hypothetical protein VHQ90_00990 [Thermoanaerobaculia bacterium]|nr:hypothetical protein [Thermoanaerobaculia bacterium]
MFWSDKTPLYSTFQLWQIDYLLGVDAKSISGNSAARLRDFEKLLRLLLRIQDHYLPEVRGDLRTGIDADYHGLVALGGTFFHDRTTYLLSALRLSRNDLIRRRLFVPQRSLKVSKLDVKALLGWIRILSVQAGHLDPLEHWVNFVRFVSYEQRQRLKGHALLAQDFYELVEVLTLFARDLGIVDAPPILLDWQYDPSRLSSSGEAADRLTKTSWELRTYGRDSLSQPYTMLEYLTNEFAINPKPRAIIFTEGDEWRGLRRLYRRLGLEPNLLGIEFRSLGGGGNFSLERWQGFIEYMHEKQVLVFFFLDRENNVEAQVKKMSNAKRIFKVPHLANVMPAESGDRDRIFVWGASFEEEFPDSIIAHCLEEHGVHVTRQKITAVRQRLATRRRGKKGKRHPKGLVAAIEEELELETSIDKGRLSERLVDQLRLVGSPRNGKRRQSGPERAAWISGELIMLNHQPIDPESKIENFETRLLG